MHLELGGPGLVAPPGQAGVWVGGVEPLTRVSHRLLAPVLHMCHASILPTGRREQQDAI